MIKIGSFWTELFKKIKMWAFVFAVAYAFNSAMCRIYNVSLNLLPTVYIILHRQTFLCRLQFLSKYKMNSYDVIKYIVNRFNRQNITVYHLWFYVVFLLYCVCVLVFILSISFCVTNCFVNKRFVLSCANRHCYNNILDRAAKSVFVCCQSTALSYFHREEGRIFEKSVLFAKSSTK